MLKFEITIKWKHFIEVWNGNLVIALDMTLPYYYGTMAA